MLLCSVAEFTFCSSRDKSAATAINMKQNVINLMKKLILILDFLDSCNLDFL